MNKKIIAFCAGLGLLFGCSSNPEFKNREELEDVVRYLNNQHELLKEFGVE